MPITQLDRGIIFSSIMREEPTVFKVWIVLLAIADETGIAPVSEAAISSIAHLDLQTVLTAIKKLSEPDPLSRSQTLEGRRILRIDGGFKIVNYHKYCAYTYHEYERLRKRSKQPSGNFRNLPETSGNFRKLPENDDVNRRNCANHNNLSITTTTTPATSSDEDGTNRANTSNTSDLDTTTTDKQPNDDEHIFVNLKALKDLKALKSSITEDMLNIKNTTNNNNTTHYTEEFEQFWQQYPRKVGKRAAYKAYNNCIKQKIVTHERLIAAIKDYANHIKKIKLDMSYIPHASTWLNGGRWDDDLSAITPKPNNRTQQDTPTYRPQYWRKP